ncbi:MAG TPA: YkvA family protein [Chthoniobacterales bacterium]|nr:YkvA family protein [Chthoniobacterales bacterium]
MKRKRKELAKDPGRNRVFAAVLDRAKWFAKNPKALRELFEEARRKMGSIPKTPFKELWAYLQAMLRLIRAYYRGDYRQISVANLIIIIAAIIYVLDPWDLIPDWIPGIGFVDDATVLAFAVQKTRETLDNFTTWETKAT